MNESKLHFDSALAALPPEWPDDPIPAIRRELAASGASIVVLDDDPTGTQTVHDVPVLTEWSDDVLAAELARATPLFYVLTNSRALTETDAAALAGRLGANLRQAARRAGREVRVISRSDSTLRGHFPAEVDALANALGKPSALRVVMPFFLEGGRYTLGDTHYVKEGEWLIPAGQTAFARDASFGYRASNLQAWVEEKTGGRIAARDVLSISLEELRRGGPEAIERALAAANAPACIVNAASMRDAEVFALGLMRAERKGLAAICRTAASIVRAMAGLHARPLLTRADLDLPADGAGLIVVGSHVPRSSGQLAHLIEHGGALAIELDVARSLRPANREAEIGRAAAAVDAALKAGRDAILYTSRSVIAGADANDSLAIGRQVSEALVQTVRSLAGRPRYLLAKGGITSSDLATKALGVRRATVLGQILPGVPVWRLGEESAMPGLAYIVFPGNVGETDALTAIANLMANG